MRARCFLALCFAFVLADASGAAHAQTQPVPTPPSRSDLPPNLLSGLDALRSDGAADAVKFWVKDSVLEGSKDALAQAETLRDIQRTFGRYQYFDVIHMQDLASRVRIVYLVLNYDRGPLFARFMLYRGPSTWLIVSFRFTTDDTAILPANAEWPAPVADKQP